LKKILCICPNPAVDSFSYINTIAVGQTNKIEKEIHHAGGKGIHVAMAAKELGIEADVVGIWAGPSGDWIREELNKMEINSLGISVKGWNRINSTLRSNTEWNDTEFVGPGPNITKLEYKNFVKTIEAILNNYSIVVMSGSWPAGAPKDAYGTLIDLCNKNNKKVVLDCSGDQLKNALIHKPFMLHINKSEMEQSVPSEYKRNPKDYYLKFVDTIALTAGAEGLFLSSTKNTIHTKCKLEKIYSAIGSGDCLTAGLTFAYLNHFSFEEMAKFACACGSANCIREELGMLYKKDVESLFKRVEVF
jgi:tagatose 6-phosphate kinase